MKTITVKPAELRSQEEQDELNAWLTEHGFTVTDCTEVRVEEEGRRRDVYVTVYDRDEAGEIRRNEHRDLMLTITRVDRKAGASLPEWVTATDSARSERTCLVHYQAHPCAGCEAEPWTAP